MKQNLYIKSLLIALFVLFSRGGVSAADETLYSENFGTASSELNLTTYNNKWTVVSGGHVKVQSSTRLGNSGRALQMGSNDSQGAEVITPTFSETLPSDITLSFYLRTNNKNNESVTLSVVGDGTIIECSGATSTLSSNQVTVTFNSPNYWYLVSLKLTGCTPQTKIKIKNIRTLYVDDIKVTGEADPRTPVTLTYSASSFTTPAESGVIEGSPELTINPEAAASEVTFSSSNESVATVDANGQVTAVSSGQTTITASIKDSETYRDAEASYELTVGLPSSNLRYNPTSVTVTYDKKDNFTAPELSYTGGYNGTITYTSSNESVATVDANGVVTILAVGVTTITASGAATQYLKASKDSCTLTVNDIQGSTTGGNGESLFKETFDKTTGYGGWNGSAGNGDLNIRGDKQNTDEDNWTVTKGYGGNKCAKFGTRNDKGYAMTRYIDVEIDKQYTLTFYAAPWDEEETSMKVTITQGCEISGISSGEMTPKQWNYYEATLTPRTVERIRIKFEAADKNRFFLDEINVAAPTTSETVNVTIPSSGWGTFCYKYPLDFTAASSPEGLKAYAVSSTSSSEATLTQITEKIIGGTGIIINGTPGATYTINVADQGAEYSGTNLLTGTLAPTYVEEGQYFLKSGKFVYSSAGTLPANKAYLKSDGTGTQGAKLSFVFDTTSIEQVKVETSDAWYDLSGRKVNPSANVKGVYIHNGKKVVK